MKVMTSYNYSFRDKTADSSKERHDEEEKAKFRRRVLQQLRERERARALEPQLAKQPQSPPIEAAQHREERQPPRRAQDQFEAKQELQEREQGRNSVAAQHAQKLEIARLRREKLQREQQQYQDAKEQPLRQQAYPQKEQLEYNLKQDRGRRRESLRPPREEKGRGPPQEEAEVRKVELPWTREQDRRLELERQLRDVQQQQLRLQQHKGEQYEQQPAKKVLEELREEQLRREPQHQQVQGQVGVEVEAGPSAQQVMIPRRSVPRVGGGGVLSSKKGSAPRASIAGVGGISRHESAASAADTKSSDVAKARKLRIGASRLLHASWFTC